MQNYFVISDMQMSLHKNSFDNQQRKFLCFIFIIKLDPSSVLICGFAMCFTTPVLASSVNK